MEILIVSATDSEIKPLFDIYSTKIDFLVTGIGIPHTILNLSNALSKKKYDLVINLGIAGSFNKSVNLGTLVYIKENCFADIGFETSNGFIPIRDSNIDPLQIYKFTNSDSIYQPKDIQSVSEITVNSTSGSSKTIKLRAKHFNADIESMEGAAVFYVCSEKQIDFIEIRSISNYIEERNTNNWNIPLAINKLNEYAICFISDLLKR